MFIPSLLFISYNLRSVQEHLVGGGSEKFVHSFVKHFECLVWFRYCSGVEDEKMTKNLCPRVPSYLVRRYGKYLTGDGPADPEREREVVGERKRERI
jgi:hypothetical protein